jgi:hypothetical protein
MFFCVTGKKCITFLLPTLILALHPVLDPVFGPTLHPATRPTQKQWVIWRLWYWRPVVGESGTWVLLVLDPSNY